MCTRFMYGEVFEGFQKERAGCAMWFSEERGARRRVQVVSSSIVVLRLPVCVCLALLDLRSGKLTELQWYNHCLRASPILSRVLLPVCPNTGFLDDCGVCRCLYLLPRACNDWDKAEEILSMMKSRGVQPNEVTYTELISICGRSGDVHQALVS